MQALIKIGIINTTPAVNLVFNLINKIYNIINLKYKPTLDLFSIITDTFINIPRNNSKIFIINIIYNLILKDTF